MYRNAKYELIEKKSSAVSVDNAENISNFFENPIKKKVKKSKEKSTKPYIKGKSKGLVKAKAKAIEKNNSSNVL